MAAFANGKIVVTEGALAVMTGHATLAAPQGVMIERFRLSHLATLRHAGTNLMTFVA